MSKREGKIEVDLLQNILSLVATQSQQLVDELTYVQLVDVI